MADKYVGSLLNRIMLPGDVIGSVADLEGSLEGKNKVKLGLGLREVNGAIVAYKAGVFRHRNPSIYLIDCNQRRVSICKVFLLTIPSFFFLSDCVTWDTCNEKFLQFIVPRKLQHRVTSYWGKLFPSTINFASRCEVTFSYRLLSKEFPLLKCLGKHFPFECTMGMNGRVWINSLSIPHTITVANAVSNSEYMNNNQIETMVKQLMKGIQS